jgi:hypothetical protein
VKQVMVRYRVKPERASENQEYVSKVFEQLEREKPAGIRYASFKLNDGVSFVHIASIERPDEANVLRELSAFKAFIAEIGARCDEPPLTVDLHEIGSYGFVAR